MQFDNKERCRRYAQKKKLKARADYIFRSWQLGVMDKSNRSPREVKASLDNIIALPYDWTEADYTTALNALSNFSTNLFLEDNVDLQKGLHSRTIKKAYTTMVQTLELATTNIEEQAEAIWQIASFVGRKLIKQQNIAKSNPNALCLATLPKSYRKPDWLEQHMQKMIEDNCRNVKIEVAKD